MNGRMDWQARNVPSHERDDWARGGGSWGQTLPAPMAAATPQPAPARPARPDSRRSTDGLPTPAGAAPGDVASIDWDQLFAAVKLRLSALASIDSDSAQAARPDRLGEMQTGVLDCVRSLDQLHVTLAHEAERRRSLEIEASNARAALALLRSQLLGARGVEVPHRPAISTDDLTGLADRSSLLERFRQVVLRHGRASPVLAALVVDLDDFGAINQAHGHETGDALLRIVAARLVRALRCDDLVGRLGGDEFACLMADVPSRDMLRHLACKLFDSVAAPIRIGSLQLTVRPSIGIALCPDDGKDGAALLASAMAASRRARHQSSGYAFHDPLMAAIAAQPANRAAHQRQFGPGGS